MLSIKCTNCHKRYPEGELPHCCPLCGGVFDFSSLPDFDVAWGSDINELGMWTYRRAFMLPKDVPRVSLGEGNTPLIWQEVNGKEIGFKLEFINPTGSFKDRGTSLLVSYMKYLGIKFAVEDSSGNAGASFAAFAARAGIRVRVYVPDYASGPKVAQIRAYGAEIVSVSGARSRATEEVLRAVECGDVYASHAYQPFGLLGFSTIAYELFEQIGGVAGTIIAPVGQGSLLLGIIRGFQVLHKAGLITNMPTFVGVQARACAPVWAVFHYGATGLGWVGEGETIAEGIRIKYPLRGDLLLQLVRKYEGTIMAVDEEDILAGRDQLARFGLYVEPTSAIVWEAIRQLPTEVPEPVIAILTGSGLKSDR